MEIIKNEFNEMKNAKRNLDASSAASVVLDSDSKFHALRVDLETFMEETRESLSTINDDIAICDENMLDNTGKISAIEEYLMQNTSITFPSQQMSPPPTHATASYSTINCEEKRKYSLTLAFQFYS